MNELPKINRRDFLKMAAVSAGSIFILRNSSEYTYATSNNVIKNYNDSGRGYFQYLDSLNRCIKLPPQIDKVIPLGRIAQDILYTICSEKMITVAEVPDREDKSKYVLNKRLYDLPETGKLHYNGNKCNIKMKAMEEMDATLILDVGDRKTDLKTNLDYIQTKTGTPVVFIDASFRNLPNAYREIGKLIGCEIRAEKLASYIDQLFDSIKDKNSKIIQRKKVYYAKGADGNAANLEDSYQSKAIEFIGGIPIECFGSDASEAKFADYVIFDNEELVSRILNFTDQDVDSWNQIEAISHGKFALAPGLIHNWFRFPIFVQCIGLVWLANAIYPEVYHYNLEQCVKQYYSLFYSYTVSEMELNYLLYGAKEVIDQPIVFNCDGKRINNRGDNDEIRKTKI